MKNFLHKTFWTTSSILLSESLLKNIRLGTFVAVYVHIYVHAFVCVEKLETHTYKAMYTTENAALVIFSANSHWAH